MKRIYITAAFTLLAALAFSQERRGPWSLDECIAWAIEHNISVRQASLAVDQASIELNSSENSRLPDLNASAGENFSFGRGLTYENTYANTNTTSTSFSIGSSVPVFNGMRIRHQILQDRLNLEAASADLSKMKDDIRLAVSQAYYQTLYSKEILAIASRQVELDSLQVERLTAMEAAGKASAVEVAQQQAVLGNSRLALTQARSNLRLALLELTQLLELPSPEGFDTADPNPSEPSGILPYPESVYADALGLRPAILAGETRLKAADESIAIARSTFFPSLSLSGGVGTNYYTTSGMNNGTFADQMKNNFSQYIGINLSIPIFNKFASRNAVRSATLQKTNQELQLENTRKALYKEIQQAWFNANAAYEKFVSSGQALSAARKSFELVEAKYENGKAGITEYTQARDAFLEAESNLSQARYEYVYQAGLLEFYRTPSK